MVINNFFLNFYYIGEKNVLHCNGNPVYAFLFWELRGQFHIHLSVSDLYSPRIGPHIS